MSDLKNQYYLDNNIKLIRLNDINNLTLKYKRKGGSKT